MAISNDSSSRQEVLPATYPEQDFEKVVAQGNRIPIPGSFDIEVRSLTRRKQARSAGQHEIRYRSIIGRRFSISARSELSGARYFSVPSNDQLNDDGTWSHEGATESGRRGSGHPTAEYSADNAVLKGGTLPNVLIRLTLSGDAPLDKATDVVCQLSIE